MRIGMAVAQLLRAQRGERLGVGGELGLAEGLDLFRNALIVDRAGKGGGDGEQGKRKC